MRALDRMNRLLNQILIWVGGCFLVIMIFLTCLNVLMRLIGKPITGTFELMGFFGAVAIAFALGYTQIKRGHIAVDIMVNKFSVRTRKVLNSINDIVCMVFFGLVAYQITRYATILWETGEVTETLRVVYYPFTYAVALACAVLPLVFLTDFLKRLTEPVEDRS